jgi:N6-adenosine-specific RNA methylase IME4
VKTLKDAKFTTLDGDGLHWGTGYWTRANAELCLLATKGAAKRRARNVHQVVIAPVAEHSRKPDKVSDRIERLVGGPYLEMFARRPRQGWTVWGNEVDPFKQEGDR